MEKGIILLVEAPIRGLDKLINYETHMPVHIADSPLDCVALGAGKAVFDRTRREDKNEVFKK